MAYCNKEESGRKGRLQVSPLCTVYKKIQNQLVVALKGLRELDGFRKHDKTRDAFLMLRQSTAMAAPLCRYSGLGLTPSSTCLLTRSQLYLRTPKHFAPGGCTGMSSIAGARQNLKDTISR